MRTIVDDAGVAVNLPAVPLRIVTLHHSQLTMPLIELGVLPAARSPLACQTFQNGPTP